MDNVLAYRLREMRTNAKLSQSDVAEKVGLNKMSIVNYESGKRVPDAITLAKFAQIYNCTSDYLLGLSKFSNQEEKEEMIEKISNLYAGVLGPDITGFDVKTQLLNYLGYLLDSIYDFTCEIYLDQGTHSQTAFKRHQMTKKIVDELCDVFDEYEKFIISLTEFSKGTPKEVSVFDLSSPMLRVHKKNSEFTEFLSKLIDKKYFAEENDNLRDAVDDELRTFI